MRSPMMAASPLASFSWLPRSSTGMKVDSLGWLFFLSGEVRTGIQQESEWPYSSHSRVHFPVRATSGRGLESEIQGEGAIKVGHFSIGFPDLYKIGGDSYLSIYHLSIYLSIYLYYMYIYIYYIYIFFTILFPFFQHPAVHHLIEQFLFHIQ